MLLRPSQLTPPDRLIPVMRAGMRRIFGLNNGEEILLGYS